MSFEAIIISALFLLCLQKTAPKDHALLPGRSLTEPGTTLMSPQQFSQGRDEGKAVTAPGKVADIGLTKEQMQEALMYMIQVIV